MATQVTLDDVAHAAGVHRSTVARALRGDPRIARATRDLARATAARLGYRPNPLVTALMQARRARQPLRHQVIAYVSCHETRFGWREPAEHLPNYFPGAARRAEELGYRVEHFWLGEPGMTAPRLASILAARCIRGLLVGRLPLGRRHLDLDLGSVSAVALGLTLESPFIHRVAVNSSNQMHEAMERCRQRGVVRPALFFPLAQAKLQIDRPFVGEVFPLPRVGEQLLATFLQMQLRWEPQHRVRPYVGKLSDQDQILPWFENERPDVIITTRSWEIMPMLAKTGIRVPGDVGLIDLTCHNANGCVAGTFMDAERIGALGVDMLTGLMNRAETGVPRDPHEVLISSHWVEGATFPKKQAVEISRT